jgi:hypothetical protein
MLVRYMVNGKMTANDLQRLKELAERYIASLPKFSQPLARRYLLRESTLNRTPSDQGFLQFISKNLPK